jgi:hypothetical protein
MQIKNKRIKILIGQSNIKVINSQPFNKITMEFLSLFSKEIFKEKKSKKYSDLITLGFWCRKQNLETLKKIYSDNFFRTGLGILFHVPPRNVPVTAIYSYIFGIISGNSNIIRISNPKLENIALVLKILKKLLNKKKFKLIKQTNCFVNYEQDDEISNLISKGVDGRLIWGGDKTIEKFKNFSTKLNCIDLMFSDKYSLSILNSNKILKFNKNELNKFIENFYNDIFLMDQNACSSPHLVCWTKNSSLKQIKIFWEKLDDFVKKKYLLSDFISSKRYLTLNRIQMDHLNLKLLRSSKSFYVLELPKLHENIKDLRGFAGIIFQYHLKSLNEVLFFLSRKIQTITYFGLQKKDLIKLLNSNRLRGIDRVVPVGQALNVDLKWDGYNIVERLTRIIDIK